MTPYERGYQACCAFLNDPCAETPVNPYDPDSLNYEEWQEGYDDYYDGYVH